jgi:hypothetical protein
MTGWLTPGVIAGLCLLALPVVLVIVWLTWLAGHRLRRSDDWQDDGNRRPTLRGKW